MNRMHRGVSLFAGCFIALAAIARLSLRLLNTHMLISHTFWYLVYLAVPQLLSLAMAAVLLRGQRGKVACGVFALNAIYETLGAFLIVSIVNSTNDVFRVAQTSLVFSMISSVFYLLVALGCFPGFGKGTRLLRWVLLVLPVVRFGTIMVTDLVTYCSMLGSACSLGLLARTMWQGFPGLATELIAEVSIALSLFLSKNTKE